MAFILTQCKTGNDKKDTTEQNNKPDTVVALIPIDTQTNNYSRLIAGKDSILSYPNSWDKDFIRNFASLTTAKINRIKKERLDKMTVWNMSNLDRNNISKNQFVFYPFSGGDFIHVNALFPEAKEYLMVAREDVGEIPNFMEKDAAFVNEYLSDVDTVLRDIYNKSYFITKNMVEDTKKRTLVNGMFPLILWASINSGHEIVGYRYMMMNDSLADLEEKTVDHGDTKPDAVEITLKIIGSEKVRKITYLSCDISDDGFVKRKSIFDYVQKKVPNGCNSFVKSASYLMHYGSFKTIRSLVMDKSQFLLQDDTGIPIKYFSNDKWKIELFGVYEKPVKDFDESVYQKDLASAYKDSSMYRGNINFSLGYHWGSRNQNQMISIKRN